MTSKLRPYIGEPMPVVWKTSAGHSACSACAREATRACPENACGAEAASLTPCGKIQSGMCVAVGALVWLGPRARLCDLEVRAVIVEAVAGQQHGAGHRARQHVRVGVRRVLQRCTRGISRRARTLRVARRLVGHASWSHGLFAPRVLHAGLSMWHALT